ncbi:MULTISPECIES: ATP-binding protein [unclassified Psychrobacter]|uniref:ATP-binding protein n=1 Tax=unclassified Psychrobacter TaxID=196806 RepID=UPI0025B38E1E|nr:MULTISPECIES: ATP-binding protein [unclassified Psychrobacter]MDN3454072.1 ATP-binding protein [Psychrobacter sp. APC 3350]MDN3501881.1 ATP-binding protein [Psychrobacter sp. 5A.1]
MNGSDATAYNLVQHTPKSVIKVAILGAESTGKTTLCRDLATHFDGPWVSEYMRTYLQAKWDDEQLTCTWDDLLPIAQGQIALENTLAKQVAQSSNSSHYLFCDTSLFELMVYSNWYYGDCPAALQQVAVVHHYDLILLTEVDTPWVADDLRDSPHQRDEISDYFASQLTRHQKPFRRIGGDREDRVRQVTEWLYWIKDKL